MLKRVFDIIFSLIALIIFGVFILFFYVLATIDNRSNGLFIQERIGQFGKIFTIFKIKTIKNNNNIEISSFSKFLRKSDRKSTRLNSSHRNTSRMPSSA